MTSPIPAGEPHRVPAHIPRFSISFPLAESRVRETRYNGLRFGPGLFQGRIAPGMSSANPSRPGSPVPQHAYPPFPLPQFCHFLSSCPVVKRPFFPKNPAVFRRNTVIFPEKRAIRGRTGLIREVLLLRGALVGVHVRRREMPEGQRKPDPKNPPSFRSRGGRSDPDFQEKSVVFPSSVPRPIRKIIARPDKPRLPG
jgi:hypothetical protein